VALLYAGDLAAAEGPINRARELDENLSDVQHALGPVEIAERLAVSKIIDGTLQRRDDVLRITIEIIDGRTGVQTWTQSYETMSGGLLAVQRRIYDDVAHQLLPAAANAALASVLPTDNESAYSLMLSANKYWQEVLDDPVVDKSLLQAAIDLYRQAAEADPSSALLQSKLGVALLYAGDLAAAEGPINRARELDENLSDVQHALGMYLYARREDGVGPHLKRAVDLNRNNVEALSDYALYLWAQADVPGARANLERAKRIDLMSITRYEVLGNFYGNGGFYDEAVELAQEVIERFDDAASYLVVARIYELTGDLDEAIGWGLRAREREPEYEPANWMLAELYTRIGDYEAARLYDTEPSITALYFSRNYEGLIDLASDLILEGEDKSPITIFALAHALTATDRSDSSALLLERQGLLEHVHGDSNTTSDTEAAVTLADAWNDSGRAEEARALAQELLVQFERFAEGHAASWHPDLNLACLQSILGEDEQALEHLENIPKRRGLAWFPIVKDQPCFRKKFAGDSRYEAVLTALLERKRKLREKLPETLERFGIPRVPTPSLFAVKTTKPR